MFRHLLAEGIMILRPPVVQFAYLFINLVHPTVEALVQLQELPTYTVTDSTLLQAYEDGGNRRVEGKSQGRGMSGGVARSCVTSPDRRRQF